jgi:Uncharacterized protein conserved in bacteria (DUF2188)
MSDLAVVQSAVDGWDVVRDDDPQALTNTATKESAIEAAEAILADEGGGEAVVHEREVHQLDDTSRGVKTYVIALLGLLAAVVVIIVVTALLASSTFS